jgi:UDP-N-acetylmuramoyl-L-alanyl-D-glutamate--2,6-diaminopimelate ligase
MDSLLRKIKKLIPRKVFSFLQPIYHYKLALLGALFYRFPAKDINVVLVTGTKGKSSTTEFINAMLESAGKKTALLGTIRFKIAEKTWPNKFKMTTPGRFFIQKFLRDAVNADCEYAILEMSSEAAKQYRHKFISLNALVFTNISPEHIESHGSFEKYLKAKLSLAKALERSNKSDRIIVANADDPESEKFLAINVPVKVSFKIEDAKPFELKETGSAFTLFGHQMHTVLPGKFNLYNILAAANYAYTQGVTLEQIETAVLHLDEIKGRVQKIQAGQNFTVVVDYAHTADSLKNLYEAFPDSQKICVLGNCGGGRDTWKRPEMARVADKYCDEIILTDEDPYDDDPEKIVEEMRVAVENKPVSVIMDRRIAIHSAIERAHELEKTAAMRNNKKIAVLISGKGTDPYIMRKNGAKEPWSDANVTEEELKKVLRQNK